MGQAASAAAIPCRRQTSHTHRSTSKSRSTPFISPMLSNGSYEYPDEAIQAEPDYISELPDECLACIFQSLNSADRNRCSLVCRRWLQVEGQSRQRLSLNAQSDLLLVIPSLFTRFDSVTKLALKCDRRSVSIGDEALVVISQRCPNMTRLKLRACRELTDAGMEVFAKNCKGLKKLSCGSCTFGARGMNALLNHCASIEELSIKRLRGTSDVSSVETIGPGVAASSLKTICLKELYNGQCFGPLILGSRNLRTLKIFRCSGDWDRIFKRLADRAPDIVEVHLERLQTSDVGLKAISNCSGLEILHLVKTPECTDLGLTAIAEQCRLLRKLHIDGWKTNRIGDEGLIAVAKHCPYLQELVLIGVNPTYVSLEMLVSNCLILERLALCGSETVGDVEISCIARCLALKKLCIKSCPVSDLGIKALAAGCPNLLKVKVKKCKSVTSEGADWLRLFRDSLAVNLDAGETELQDASAGDDAHENDLEFPSIPTQAAASANIASSSAGRSSSFKSRLGLFSGKSYVACTLRKLSLSGGNRSSRHG